jgi:hypothetical protein
VLGTG